MIKTTLSVFLFTFIVFGVISTAVADDPKTGVIPQVPTPGMVTMVDLGSHKCIPCKMMAPIITELQKEYAGRASIIFIDVRKHPEQAKRFGIRAIPTQIFYDKQGNEVGRHVGYLDKKSIVAAFDDLKVSEGTPQ